jgi:uncharacterized protein DUF5996
MTDHSEAWPPLPYEAWKDTLETLHLWTQVVGKVRLTQSPWVNHSWHVTLYVTSRGLSTSPIAHGTRTFEIEFDFLAHRLAITTGEGQSARVPLEPQTVATFYTRLMDSLDSLGLHVKINATPNEIPDAVPFARDETHRSYDPVYANRFWRVLVQADRVFKMFRARFAGKCSPVHFFWGGGDLAVTRFSGRTAPVHPGGIPNLPDRITREAYSHEVSSAGFWAGGGPVAYPVFYSYAYPEPAGFAQALVAPAAASYNQDLREFILPYDAVRQSASPDETLLAFLQSTYEAAAGLAGWDRRALEQAAAPA